MFDAVHLCRTPFLIILKLSIKLMKETVKIIVKGFCRRYTKNVYVLYRQRINNVCRLPFVCRDESHRLLTSGQPIKKSLVETKTMEPITHRVKNCTVTTDHNCVNIYVTYTILVNRIKM